MAKKIEYKIGDRVGPHGFVYLGDAPPVVEENGKKRRMLLLRCKCGNTKVVDLTHARNGSIKSCGCHKRISENNPNYKHGQNKTKVYGVWLGIKKRCCNPNELAYRYYGGRGIKIHESWKNNFVVFRDYVATLPHFGEDGYTIDRINNNGHYEPGNVRWATRRTQSLNRRTTYSKNIYNFVGVSQNKNTLKWVAYLTKNRKMYLLGTHESIFKAVGARNNFIIKNGLWEYPVQAVLDYMID